MCIRDRCIEAPEVPEERNLALATLLTAQDRPTAVLVSDDILAMALEKTCAELGISIPGDLSIISFNNSLFARLTYPPLTSMDINSFQLGIEAASQMISHIETPDLMATKTIVPHHIVADVYKRQTRYIHPVQSPSIISARACF